MKVVVFLFLLTAPMAQAFLLVSPNYHLANPEETVVNIASGGCTANGMSNAELSAAIEDVINSYWNRVTESRLRLKLGSEVSRSISSAAEPGEILVGCAPMGMSGPSGVTYPNDANGSSRLVLNATTFVPGGYLPEGLIGVLVHEMGHAVGLGHSGDAASVMTYEAHEWGPRPKHLSQDDKDGVVFLYPHEGELGGLIGGCSALAHEGRSRVSSFWPFAIEVLCLALLSFVLNWIIRRFPLKQY